MEIQTSVWWYLENHEPSSDATPVPDPPAHPSANLDSDPVTPPIPNLPTEILNDAPADLHTDSSTVSPTDPSRAPPN